MEKLIRTLGDESHISHEVLDEWTVRIQYPKNDLTLLARATRIVESCFSYVEEVQPRS